MIIVLEGINGGGKSTTSKIISQQTGITVCRPFRSNNSDLHWGRVEHNAFEVWLKQMMVPMNSHVNDMYVADLMATFKLEGILDRTMPSAIAYGKVFDHFDGFYHGPGVSQKLFEYWQARLVDAGHVLYVWLTCNYEAVKQRCSTRWKPNKAEYTKLRTQFEHIFQRCALPKLRLDTSDMPKSDVVNVIIKRVGTIGSA
jgi:thymidylate kinase